MKLIKKCLFFNIKMVKVKNNPWIIHIYYKMKYLNLSA